MAIDLLPSIGRDRTTNMLARCRVSESARRRILGLPHYQMPEPVTAPRAPVVRRTPKTCAMCGAPVESRRVYCSTRCYKMMEASRRTAHRGVTIEEAKAAAPSLPGTAVHRIQAIVAGVYGIEESMMRAASRERQYTHPRQAAMALALRLAGRSTPDIGRVFGNRDHTTVIHAVRKVDERLADTSERWADWREKYRRAEAACRAALGLNADPDRRRAMMAGRSA